MKDFCSNPSEPFMAKSLQFLPSLVGHELSKCVTLCLEYYLPVLSEILTKLSDDLKYQFYKSMFSIDRGRDRNTEYFKNYVVMLLEIEPTKLAEILAETGFGSLLFFKHFFTTASFFYQSANLCTKFDPKMIFFKQLASYYCKA